MGSRSENVKILPKKIKKFSLCHLLLPSQIALALKKFYLRENVKIYFSQCFWLKQSDSDDIDSKWG